MVSRQWRKVLVMIVDTILFDLDGTLVDSAPLVGGILNVMRGERGLSPLGVENFRRLISLGANELVERALEVPAEEVYAFVETFRIRYRELSTPADSLFPGVAETVITLAEDGIHLGVCSNKPERLCRKVLDDVGLVQYFGAVVGGDSATRPKPDCAPLHLALSALGRGKAGAILVGDSTVDQRAAEAVGIPFVFFSAGYDDGVKSSAAWAYIDTVAQLLDFVLPNRNKVTRGA